MQFHFIHGDDWVVVYLNGKFLTEGHSISGQQLIEEIVDRSPNANVCVSEESKPDEFFDDVPELYQPPYRSGDVPE